MEQNIETKELSNGDVLHFLKKLKGKQIREITKLQSTIKFNVDSKGKKEADPGDALEAGLGIFPIVCEKVVANGKEVKPTLDYLDDLYQEDFLKVTEFIGEIMASMNTPKAEG